MVFLFFFFLSCPSCRDVCPSVCACVCVHFFFLSFSLSVTVHTLVTGERAMKWLARLFRRKPRTPLPPKPYVDTASTGRHMLDARLYDPNDLSHVDPEKPHWQDARFESRQRVPFFDLFGYNRDWSWTIFKLSGVFFIAIFYWETRSMIYMKNNPIKVSSTTNVSPVPDYARDEKATEEELRAAGFAYVGVKKLDNLGITLSDNPHDERR